MKTNLTIEAIAELLGKKVWNGKRIYMNNVGYNTKKMSTKAYYYMVGNEIKASVTVECYSQPEEWCSSQEGQFEESMMERIAGLLPEEVIAEVPEVIASETIVTTEGEIVDLSEKVKGFYPDWREVRIAINRFGKLATRNRQFLVVTEISKNEAPANFQILSDEDFEIVKNYTNGEKMLEPYVEACDKVKEILETVAHIAEYRRQQEAAEIEKLANDKIKAEQQKIAQEKLTNELNSLNGADLLKAWKEAGCIHPAPAMVAEFKSASGLGWKAFVETI